MTRNLFTPGREALRGTVVHEGRTDRHVCGPGWVWHEASAANDPFPLPFAGYYWRDPYDVPAGTVVQCDCGATWVCVRDPGYATKRHALMPRNVWRLETRRERKWRERRAGGR